MVTPETTTIRRLEEIADVSSMVARRCVARLTRQELKVAELITKGKTNEDIADALHISLKTLERHRSNVKLKLDAPTLGRVAVVLLLARVHEAPHEVAEARRNAFASG